MREHRSHFIGGHHAGVTAEDVDMVIRHAFPHVFQRCVDLHDGQSVVTRGLVKADASLRAGAVVPQNRDCPVSRILRQAVAQELFQAVRTAHGNMAPVLQFLKVPVPDHRQRPGVAFQVLQIPFLRTACQDHHVDGVPGLHLRHLHQVLAARVLQVRAAHVYQQGGRFPAGSGRGKYHDHQQDDPKDCPYFHERFPPFFSGGYCMMSGLSAQGGWDEWQKTGTSVILSSVH